MEGVLQVTEALVGARGGLVELTRVFHVPGLVRALVVVALDEAIELGLLLQEVLRGRLGVQPAIQYWTTKA